MDQKLYKAWFRSFCMGFGSGIFEKRVIASSKLSSLEKYGFTYTADLDLIKEYVNGVSVEDIGDGKVKVHYNNEIHEAEVRDYIKPSPQEEQPANGHAPAQQEPAKPRHHHSIFDVNAYD